MKYIDADKLKAEIERYENTAIDAYNPLGEDADFWHGKVVACEDIKTFVNTIQQEQPEGGCSEKPNNLLSELDVYLEKASRNVYESWMGGTMNDIRRDIIELGKVLNARKKEKLRPSFPSNLDEAAKDSWAVYEYRESPRGLYSTCYVDGFKAGAEWMAGQGVTLNISIDEFSCGAYNACVEQGLSSEDDVIVQIRKK